MKTMRKAIDWLTINRNLIFLAVCLVIHAAYLWVFNGLKIWPLAFLNLLSCCFYLYLLFMKKDTSDESIANTFFEILIFSFFSELALGPDFGFFLYIVGMIPAIFYLIPSYKNRRFLFQFIGAFTAFLVEGIIIVGGVSFPELQNQAAPYQKPIYMINLVIMMLIVLSATFFYSRETEKVWETLSHNMNHDVLTGLYNRRFFERQMELIPENQRSQYVISMIDIDNFKKVNDTYGHEAGDAVLIKVASCLMEAAGKENLAVRWGGEEFILYFPKTTPDKVQPVMETIRSRVQSEVVKTGGKEIHITVTAGIATGMADSNYEKVIKTADEKLYLGKQRGKNCIII